MVLIMKISKKLNLVLERIEEPEKIGTIACNLVIDEAMCHMSDMTEFISYLEYIIDDDIQDFYNTLKRFEKENAIRIKEFTEFLTKFIERQ